MNKTLQNYLDNTVMKHIDDVRHAFEYCANTEEIRETIDRIPAVFGDFSFGRIESDYFEIINDYMEYGANQSKSYCIDWYIADDLEDYLCAEDAEKYLEVYRDNREYGMSYSPDDFRYFVVDFESDEYNISAIEQAFNIACYGVK